MNTQQEQLDMLLEEAKDAKSQREGLELALAACRQRSKNVAIRLIFDHGYALQKTALLTGHARPTLRVWVDAEIARRADDGLQSPIVTDDGNTPPPHL